MMVDEIYRHRVGNGGYYGKWVWWLWEEEAKSVVSFSKFNVFWLLLLLLLKYSHDFFPTVTTTTTTATQNIHLYLYYVLKKSHCTRFGSIHFIFFPSCFEVSEPFLKPKLPTSRDPSWTMIPPSCYLFGLSSPSKIIWVLESFGIDLVRILLTKVPFW